MRDFIIAKGHRDLCKISFSDCVIIHSILRMFQNTEFITAAKRMDVGNGIEYLLMWKDGWKNDVISSNEAKEKWPQLVFNFLKHISASINWKTKVDSVHFPLWKTMMQRAFR